MNEKSKRKPNWTLCVKAGERWQNIGAAWETEKGNLYLKVDEGERLTGTAMLFPYREKPPMGGGGGGYARPRSYPPKRPLPPIQDAAAMVEPDYMEQRRARRANATPPPSTDDVGPNLDAPDDPEWLR